MEIIGICRYVEILRNVSEVLVGRRSHLHYFTKCFSFLLCLCCPHTCVEICGLLLKEVVRHHAELKACSATEEEYRVTLWNVEEFLEESYRFVNYWLEIFSAVAYFHE